MVQVTNREKLLEVAKTYVGQDASPFDAADDELGCAESVSTIIRKGIFRDFPIELATWLLLPLLRRDKRFKATLGLTPGNIILSPTGYGNGRIRGHVGIISDNSMIMSSNSLNGLWEENYTVSEWVARYRTLGELPIYVFEPLGEFVESLEQERQIAELQKKLTWAQKAVETLKSLILKLI